MTRVTSHDARSVPFSDRSRLTIASVHRSGVGTAGRDDVILFQGTFPVATITATKPAIRYNPSTPETRHSGGLVHRSPGSVNKPRSVEAGGEERVRVRAEAADRKREGRSRP